MVCYKQPGNASELITNSGAGFALFNQFVRFSTPLPAGFADAFHAQE